jgi:energy-coupling factor transporter ATP-binding protein EcfA2
MNPLLSSVPFIEGILDLSARSVLPMRIQQISVSGLFGIFDHVIPLNIDERITIIHSPNGFGKTAILRMLNGFFNSQYSVFRTLPFTKFRVDLDNGNSVEVLKTSEAPEKGKKREHISFVFYESGLEKPPFPLKAIKSPLDIDFSVDILDDVIPELLRVGAKTWRYLPTGETLALGDVIDRFEDILPSKVKLRGKPEWLETLKNDIHVGLRKAIGSVKTSEVEPTSLERSLRLAYEDTYFSKTQMYLSICSWEIENQPFKILANR